MILDMRDFLYFCSQESQQRILHSWEKWKSWIPCIFTQFFSRCMEEENTRIDTASMRDLWLSEKVRECGWWDLVIVCTHMAVSISVLFPRSSDYPVQPVGLHARSRKCEVLYYRYARGMLSNEGVGDKKTSFVCMQRVALSRIGKPHFWTNLSWRFG